MKAEVNALFHREPSVNAVALGELIKQRNPALRGQVQNDFSLSKKFTKLVSESLSKAKGFLKKKLFSDGDSARYDSPLDEFTGYLFGGKDAYLDDELRLVAAVLRYFRDANEHYKEWRKMEEPQQLTNHIKAFFQDFAEFYDGVKEDREFLEKVVKSDTSTYI